MINIFWNFAQYNHDCRLRRFDDLHLRLPPLDLRVLGEAALVLGEAALVLGEAARDDAFGVVRGTVVDTECAAVLQNAGCNLHLGDGSGPVHLHWGIMGRKFGVGCIENLLIANRPIALIGPSRWIVLAMTLFTLASSWLATSRSCGSRSPYDHLYGLRNCACSIARRTNSDSSHSNPNAHLLMNASIFRECSCFSFALSFSFATMN